MGTNADVDMLQLAEKICVDLGIHHVDVILPDEDELPQLIPITT
jgi:hypothetical protein